MTAKLQQLIALRFRPTRKLRICEWLHEHVDVQNGPIPGKFSVENSPWIRAPLEAVHDPKVREIICTCSVQSAKTEALVGFIVYFCAEIGGGDMMVFSQTDRHTKEFLDTRLSPRIRDTKRLFAMLPRKEKSITSDLITFAHMTVFVRGAHSKKNLQSIPARALACDEAAYWPHGHMDEARKRTTAFDGRNSKRFFVGTPLKTETEYHKAFMAGSRHVWCIPCPSCKELNEPKIENFEWNGVKNEDGDYVWNEVIPSIRYKCPHCEVEHADTPANRKFMADHGAYVQQNPNPDPETLSFHWNSFAVPWVKWGLTIKEYLVAKKLANEGDLTPLEEWTNKRMGDFWDDKAIGDEIAPDLQGGFAMEEPWEDEFQRYLSIDVQKDYFRAVCRAFAADGRSRMVWAGTITSWPELEELPKKLGIKGRRVFIDSNYERETGEVYRRANENGWICCIGSKLKSFRWQIKQPDGSYETVERYYSRLESVDAGAGMKRRGDRTKDMAKRIHYSSDSVKFFLHRLRAGRGVKWEVPADAPKFYLDEIQGEVIRIKSSKETGGKKRYLYELRECHSWDCEAMNLVQAMIEGLIGKRVDGKDAVAEEEEDANEDAGDE